MSAILESSLLERLIDNENNCRLSVAVVVAHPDDEVIGLGAQLPSWPLVRLIHITDGAPRNMMDAAAAGCSTRQEYASKRKRELHRALALAGIQSSQLEELSVVDQEASFALSEISRFLCRKFTDWRPGVVVTHSYEGGHPDHDATAFAVHSACELLRRQGSTAPAIVEMTSYFNSSGSMATGTFLPGPHTPVRQVRLSSAQRDLKRQMFACFATQAHVLQYFPDATEAFRLAPDYDFSHPPHDGKLYYELFDWGVMGQQWRARAVAALRALGLLT